MVNYSLLNLISRDLKGKSSYIFIEDEDDESAFSVVKRPLDSSLLKANDISFITHEYENSVIIRNSGEVINHVIGESYSRGIWSIDIKDPDEYEDPCLMVSGYRVLLSPRFRMDTHNYTISLLEDRIGYIRIHTNQYVVSDGQRYYDGDLIEIGKSQSEVRIEFNGEVYMVNVIRIKEVVIEEIDSSGNLEVSGSKITISTDNEVIYLRVRTSDGSRPRLDDIPMKRHGYTEIITDTKIGLHILTTLTNKYELTIKRS